MRYLTIVSLKCYRGWTSAKKSTTKLFSWRPYMQARRARGPGWFESRPGLSWTLVRFNYRAVPCSQLHRVLVRRLGTARSVRKNHIRSSKKNEVPYCMGLDPYIAMPLTSLCKKPAPPRNTHTRTHII